MANRNTRQNIIKCAEEVMARKGLQLATISEIADKCGVADSAIYHHFKGKEDLLFSVVEERTIEFLDNLSQHLRGIIDPTSKLTKLIWFHLYNNERHPEYLWLLILECRSNPSFYSHRAYLKVREYAGILTSVLKDGVNKNVFAKNLNIQVMRDIIFGVIDLETIGWLALEETSSLEADLDDIMALILPMVSSISQAANDNMNKANQILTAAEKVFSEKGFAKATISDIAKMAGVSEGTISNYYKNKQNLLYAIPEKRFNEHLDAMSELFNIKDPIRKLRRIIYYHFHLYLTQIDFLKIFLLHIQLSTHFYKTKAYKIFQKYIDILTPVLEEGKRIGLFRPEVNDRVFRNLFLGAFSHMTLRWVLIEEGAKPDKTEEIDEVVGLLCKSIAAQQAILEYHKRMN